MMATIYSADGNVLTDGLQGCGICDEAIQAARSIAADRGEAVELHDDDGVWSVEPDGSCEHVRPEPAFYIHCTSSTHEFIDRGPFETVEEALAIMRLSAERYAGLLGCVIRYCGGDGAREIRECGEIVADSDDYYNDEG